MCIVLNIVCIIIFSSCMLFQGFVYLVVITTLVPWFMADAVLTNIFFMHNIYFQYD